MQMTVWGVLLVFLQKSAELEPKPQSVNSSKQHLPSICSWQSFFWFAGWLTHGCSCTVLYPQQSYMHTQRHKNTLSISVNTSEYTSIHALILFFLCKTLYKTQWACVAHQGCLSAWSQVKRLTGSFSIRLLMKSLAGREKNMTNPSKVNDFR